MISLKNVKVQYQVGEVTIQALNVNELTIRQGEFITILGPSGSGKTTLLNIIGGLDTPTSGSVNSCDMELVDLNDKKLTDYRKEKIGFVFQFFNLIPTLTAYENIKMGAEIVKKPRDIHGLLEIVGLSDRKEHFPAQLSGGQQQRVSIARAVAKNPSILLCDEPTGALDTKSGKQVLELLYMLAKKEKKTVIIVTHDEEISEISDRTIFLRDGEIVEDKINITPKSLAEV
ncbi:ATP-binding cassette domain-containing protein [Sporosarcina limicola]|uniref:ABC transport system ATP-binding protein n=1 Tax=Sporosarcina limicola TaxID=34101 RepID=A0A927MLS7_9BACL|nr:putative ABC transport system ATP-binding protein [Sporosarcina limicola]